MQIEENGFVREVTQRLYSSLQIEKALFVTFKYLQNFFPLDIAHMFIYDTVRHTLRYLSLATEKNGVLIDEQIHISDRAIREIQHLQESVVTIFTKSTSVLVQEIFSHFRDNTTNALYPDDQDFSAMAVFFDVGQPLVGGFGIVARGTDAFRDEHKPLLKTIRQALTGSVLNLLHHRELVCRNERLEREKADLQDRLGHLTASRIIGAESGLQETMRLVRDVAPLKSPVLLMGETGVGKEVIATVIHQASGRSRGPMISINCGAVPETLIDSEMFGHEKGAFTGAEKQTRGYFEQADRGTIFLDEIGELPLFAQVKLLRVLQTMEFHRVGGSRPVSVDVRVIAATNRNLLHLIQNGQFREDLWFRLNVFPIHIPPLRKRSEDIPAMASYFAVRKSQEMNLVRQPVFAPEAFQQLKDYGWPGNIRELQNVIERALITSQGNPLSFPNLDVRKEEVPGQSMQSAAIPPLEDVIIRHIQKALTVAGGRIFGKNGAAELLGVHPSTLRGKMRKYGIRITRSVGGPASIDK